MTSMHQELDVVAQRVSVPSCDEALSPADADDVRLQTETREFAIEISHDFAAIEADWRMLEADGALTPFQSIAWLSPLYRVLAPRMNAIPLFVLVRDRPSGRPAMLLPLCVQSRFGFSFLEFADFGACDYNAPVLAKDFDPSQAEWSVLWRAIVARVKGFASLMRLQKLPQVIDDRANPLAQDEFAAAMTVGSWGVTLPETIERYDDTVLTSTFRKELAKKTRRVAKRGEIEWIAATSADDRMALFDKLACQRQARCDEMGRHNVLSEPAFREFYNAATSDPLTASLVRLNALKVGSETVAAMLSLRHGDATHVIMTTFEGGEWKSASLGNVLIREAIARNILDGVRYFDLTIGDEAYKQDFGATRLPLYSVLRPLSLLGVGLAVGVSAATRLRNRRIS